jgi:hypothetical protein
LSIKKISASVLLVISDQNLPVEKWESEGFLLLPSSVVFLGAPTRHAEVQTEAEASCEGV